MYKDILVLRLWAGSWWSWCVYRRPELWRENGDCCKADTTERVSAMNRRGCV